MKPLCPTMDDHDWAFCEGEEQMGLREGDYCAICGVNRDDASEIHSDEP